MSNEQAPIIVPGDAHQQATSSSEDDESSTSSTFKMTISQLDQKVLRICGIIAALVIIIFIVVYVLYLIPYAIKMSEEVPLEKVEGNS